MTDRLKAPATRPARESQCGRILRLLERHPNQWILNSSIYAECGSMGALHSRMAELRNRWGKNIVCESNRTRTRYKLVTLSEGEQARGMRAAGGPPSLSEGGADREAEPPSALQRQAAPLPPSLNEQLRIVA